MLSVYKEKIFKSKKTGMNMKINKKGLSPVITTVLLIALVAVLAIIVLLWARKFLPESIMKDGRNIERVCEDVAFEASLKSSIGDPKEILVSNNGNIPIYAFEALLYSEGETNSQELIPTNITSGEEINLVQGASGNMSINVGSSTKIKLTPILIGNVGEAEKKYTCTNHPGKEITL